MRQSRRKTFRTHELRDALAEIVAEGGTVEYAGRALGLSNDETAKVWAGICADLGEVA